jgi:hypothetical protein
MAIRRKSRLDRRACRSREILATADGLFHQTCMRGSIAILRRLACRHNGKRTINEPVAEWDDDMPVLDHAEASETMPINSTNESHFSDLMSGSDDHLSGNHETVYVWRHPELIGVELFRGVYKRYQAARHFHLGPAIGIVQREL